MPLDNQRRFRRVNTPFSQVIRKSVHYFGQELIGRANERTAVALLTRRVLRVDHTAHGGRPSLPLPLPCARESIERKKEKKEKGKKWKMANEVVKKTFVFSRCRAARRAGYVSLIKKERWNCASMKNPCATPLRKCAHRGHCKRFSPALVFLSRAFLAPIAINFRNHSGDRCKSNFRPIGLRVVGTVRGIGDLAGQMYIIQGVPGASFIKVSRENRIWKCTCVHFPSRQFSTKHIQCLLFWKRLLEQKKFIPPSLLILPPVYCRISQIQL